MATWKFEQSIEKGKDTILFFTFGIVPAYMKKIRLALPTKLLQSKQDFYVVGKRGEIPDLKIKVEHGKIVDVQWQISIPANEKCFVITSATTV